MWLTIALFHAAHAEPPQYLDRPGEELRASGDVNGDGFDDLLVQEGFTLRLYAGSAAGIDWSAPMWSRTGESSTQQLAVGDVNGDGLHDLLLGQGHVFEGAECFLGTATGWPSTADVALPGSRFSAVHVIGDMTGDGYAEVVVAPPVNEDSYSIFLGSSAGPQAASPQVYAHDLVGGAWWISSGDVSGDGLADLMMGTGEQHIVYGSVAGLPAAATRARISGGAFDLPRIIGDVDGDGIDDVMAGELSGDDWTPIVLPGAVGGLDPAGIAAASALRLDPVAEPFTWLPDGYVVSVDADLDGVNDLLISMAGAEAGESGEGIARLYTHGSTGLEASPSWTAQGNARGASMLGGVTMDSDGDGLDEVWFQVRDQGLPQGLRVYESSTSGLGGGMPDLTWQPNRPMFWVGLGLAGADLDGDGFSELIVGDSEVHFRDDDTPSQFVVLPGGPGGLGPAPAQTIPATSSGDRVVPMGDLDGDGFVDLLLGQERDVQEGLMLPSCYVPHPHYYYNYYTSEGYDCPGYVSGWSILQAGAPTTYPSEGFFYGAAATNAGDVNGDGFTDLVAYASQDSVGVWYGTALGTFSEFPDWTLPVAPTELHVAHLLAGIGDIDGDGYADLAVGDPGTRIDTLGAGTVQVFLGGPAGPTHHLTIMGQTADAGLGVHVAAAGDVNADGYADLLVSTMNDGAQLHLGSATGFDAVPDWEVPRIETTPHGYHAWPAGDLDGDGHADIVVQPVDLLYDVDDNVSMLGIADYRGTESVRVFLGGPTGPSSVAYWAMDQGWGTGTRALGVGDLDGDGYGELALSGNQGLIVLHGPDLAPSGEVYPLPGDTGDTGHTADTGAAGTTGDTGEPPTTPDTGSAAGDDDDDDPISTSGESSEEEGCSGCQTRRPSTLGFGWFALLTRR